VHAFFPQLLTRLSALGLFIIFSNTPFLIISLRKNIYQNRSSFDRRLLQLLNDESARVPEQVLSSPGS
jgi:hypothetical protein